MWFPSKICFDVIKCYQNRKSFANQHFKQIFDWKKKLKKRSRIRKAREVGTFTDSVKKEFFKWEIKRKTLTSFTNATNASVFSFAETRLFSLYSWFEKQINLFPLRIFFFHRTPVLPHHDKIWREKSQGAVMENLIFSN